MRLAIDGEQAEVKWTYLGGTDKIAIVAVIKKDSWIAYATANFFGNNNVRVREAVEKGAYLTYREAIAFFPSLRQLTYEGKAN